MKRALSVLATVAVLVACAESPTAPATTPDVLAKKGGVPGKPGGADPTTPWLVFASRRSGFEEVYLMKSDGSAERQIGDLQLIFSTPAISPDGSLIAFSAGPDGSQTLWVMKRNGTGLRQLTTSGDAGDPAWSPDGTRIVFSNLPTHTAGVGIFVINVDGTGLAQLTWNTDAMPAWSPDGHRIAFARNVATWSTAYWDVFVMDADGSNVSRLTTTGGGGNSGFSGHPAWSPDGERIAFSSNRIYSQVEIYVMNADGSGLTQLTFDSANDDCATWSPDGASLVFHSDRSGNYDIWKMNADGSNLTQLTTDPGADLFPYWRK